VEEMLVSSKLLLL